MNSSNLEKNIPSIAKAVDGVDLSSEETETTFEDIFLNDRDGYYFAVLMTALHAKGETADELYGIIRVFQKLSESFTKEFNKEEITDLSGTGGGNFKTKINVSTAASFIVAAAGYKVAKASFFGVTSKSGSADMFLELGIDISKLTKKDIVKNIKIVGISPYYVPYISPKLENRGKLFMKIFIHQGLRVRSPFHLTTNAFSPFPVKRRIYGCYSPKYLVSLAKMFSKMKMQKTFTFYADKGIPEISNVGKTTIAIQEGKNISLKTFRPKDFGVLERKEKDIAFNSKEDNLKNLIAVLKGKAEDSLTDLVAINAGASLFVLGDVKSFKEGTQKAKEIIKSGKGYEVLQRLQKIQAIK